MREGRGPRRGTPPRVQRSFGFVDLCGFTDYADKEGDDQAADVLHILRASLRETATNHGVRIDKWLGDGAMLVSVEPPPLLAAMVEAKWAIDGEVPLGIRAGAAAGPVMVFEGDDYIGQPINLASKLCELAKAGQLLAPAALAGACPVGLSMTPLGPLGVSGFTDPVAVVAIDVSGDDAGEHRRGLGAAVGSAVRDRRHGDSAHRH